MSFEYLDSATLADIYNLLLTFLIIFVGFGFVKAVIRLLFGKE